MLHQGHAGLRPVCKHSREHATEGQGQLPRMAGSGSGSSRRPRTAASHPCMPQMPCCEGHCIIPARTLPVQDTDLMKRRVTRPPHGKHSTHQQRPSADVIAGWELVHAGAALCTAQGRCDLRVCEQRRERRGVVAGRAASLHAVRALTPTQSRPRHLAANSLLQCHVATNLKARQRFVGHWARNVFAF